MLVLGLLLGLQVGSQLIATRSPSHLDVGPSLRLPGGVVLLPFWTVVAVQLRGEAVAPRDVAVANGVGLLVLMGAIGVLLLLDREPSIHRRRGWGTIQEAQSAGLCAAEGCVLGELAGRVLITADLRPTLVTGGTRSGKGRGHVVPSLLCWPESVMVHDPKGELWSVSSGWRRRFSHALRFDPRSMRSARWNPLAEIEPGTGELAQVQRLVAVLADPGGARDEDGIWDKAACEILEALILHVLYTADDGAKTLLHVRALLSDLDGSAEMMLQTCHRRDEDGAPTCHPFIRAAAQGYAGMHDRFRTSVQGTARSYLKWLAGDDVERALSASDFRMGDLMCAEAPLSLYVQVAPADSVSLKPLVRLLFYAAAQALTAQEHTDGSGRSKRHKLLMVMDEFPLLGRIAFFEKSLRLMSGYGVKVMFVAQSLNDIQETYGPSNTILDNCMVFTAFAALDPLTQDKVSRLTGTIRETRTSRSGPSGLAAGRQSVSRAEIERPLLEPGEIRGLADDEQLIFVAGRRPFRTRKLQYDRRTPFRERARHRAPSVDEATDAPPALPHPWRGRRAMDPAGQVRRQGHD